jgi:hypothetical protein
MGRIYLEIGEGFFRTVDDALSKPRHAFALGVGVLGMRLTLLRFVLDREPPGGFWLFAEALLDGPPQGVILRFRLDTLQQDANEPMDWEFVRGAL